MENSSELAGNSRPCLGQGGVGGSGGARVFILGMRVNFFLKEQNNMAYL
jgi:hypothetical protein